MDPRDNFVWVVVGLSSEVGRGDGRTDRVIVSSLDVCLASAAALAGTTKAAARCPFSISLAFVAFVVFFISAP